MRALLQNLGNHEAFEDYRDWFRGLYCNPNRPVFDVMGRLVIFDTYPTLDDCAHVCYGGTTGHAYNQAFWSQERAERIASIDIVLIHPNKIHPDEGIPTNQKYLLCIPPEAPGQESEYYVAIVRVLNSKTVAFLTAYGISNNQYQKFAMIGPRVFTAPQPKRKKR